MIYGDDNSILAEGPVLPEGAPWRCPYCGESYRFLTHPSCLAKAIRERDEAQAAAKELKQLLWPGGAPAWDKKYSWMKESDATG